MDFRIGPSDRLKLGTMGPWGGVHCSCEGIPLSALYTVIPCSSFSLVFLFLARTLDDSMTVILWKVLHSLMH